MDTAPTTIFTAATVHAQAAAPVEAFAVTGERVLATGGLAELREAFPRARVCDFGDSTIVPGFNDAHIHIGLTAEDLLHLDLSHAAVSTVDDLLSVVRAEALRAGAGDWVRGARYDDVKTGAVTRRQLDAVAGNVPVIISHVAAHWGVANSAALAALGYHDDSQPPPGGDFGRDADGRLDGRLIERALLDVLLPATGRGESPIRPSTEDERLTGVRRAVERWHGAGLTSICDALASPADIALLRRARRTGDLTLRTGFLLAIDHYDRARELGVGSGFGDDHLRMVGVKGFVDGAIGGRTCLLSEPFTGTDDHGLQITGTADLAEQVARVHADGNRMGVHANGDAAIRVLLDVYESVAGNGQGLRHRIEHCSLVDDEILRRMKALDVIAVPFAGYPAYHGGALESWYGAERTGRMFAHRSFVDHGITVAGSSDYPCGPYEPLVGLQSMVTRRGIDDGALVGGRQCISAAEALEIYTIGSAAASGDEHRLGRLAPGFLADFAVLDRDPLVVEPDTIAETAVRHTYVGGSRVWTAPS
ncbi:amidohydrolase [Prauserella cavernicola]|uniref:Amidohydrolase n=1 Tax=Prauserella cavernicola TaxID=2800127 RepID=A0A934QY54_9PSEU|nr:amidohydrolase [Prauserella cavernicola]MBK1788297.1 amidohydrolase [Prauserella cavernicola]